MANTDLNTYFFYIFIIYKMNIPCKDCKCVNIVLSKFCRGKKRNYILRNNTLNIDELNENNFKIVYEDDPKWDGSGCLMVILDKGEPITLDMLKKKSCELECYEEEERLNAVNNADKMKALEDENKLLKEQMRKVMLKIGMI